MIVLRIHCPVWMAEKYLEQFQPDRFKDAWEAAYQPLDELSRAFAATAPNDVEAGAGLSLCHHSTLLNTAYLQQYVGKFFLGCHGLACAYSCLQQAPGPNLV